MQFARWVFTIGGIWGLILIAPLYFMEGLMTRDRGPLAYPEHYYGFVGCAFAFQLLYLAIGRDPARLRPIMPIGVLGKLSFGIAVWVLFAQGRTPGIMAALSTGDLILAVLFTIAYLRTRNP